MHCFIVLKIWDWLLPVLCCEPPPLHLDLLFLKNYSLVIKGFFFSRRGILVYEFMLNIYKGCWFFCYTGTPLNQVFKRKKKERKKTKVWSFFFLLHCVIWSCQNGAFVIQRGGKTIPLGYKLVIAVHLKHTLLFWTSSKPIIVYNDSFFFN